MRYDALGNELKVGNYFYVDNRLFKIIVIDKDVKSIRCVICDIKTKQPVINESEYRIPGKRPKTTKWNPKTYSVSPSFGVKVASLGDKWLAVKNFR